MEGDKEDLAVSKSLHSQLSDDNVTDTPQAKKQKQGEALILKKLQILENRMSTRVEVRKHYSVVFAIVLHHHRLCIAVVREVAYTDCNRAWCRDND